MRKSVSITEEEALQLNVIDLISPDLQDLLAKLEGRAVKFDGVTRTLLTKGVQPQPMRMSWRYRLLDTISNPTIAYILLMLGIYGVFFELSNPGAILPGVVGGIFLILAFYALQMLPINFAGLALILFAIILFIAEIKVVSHGILAVGGVISLLLGSLMLIESPTEYMRISLSVIIPAVLVSAAFFTFAVTKAIKARLTKPTTGTEGLVGEIGTAATPIAPEGKISIHGEFWNANYRRQTIAGRKTKTKIREAITEYKLVKKIKNNFSLLEIFPKTGRTHQIRVHLFSIGNPIVGDKLYKRKTQSAKFETLRQPADANRHMLHAKEIKFKLFGKDYDFSVEPPVDFQSFLK